MMETMSIKEVDHFTLLILLVQVHLTLDMTKDLNHTRLVLRFIIEEKLQEMKENILKTNHHPHILQFTSEEEKITIILDKIA